MSISKSFKIISGISSLNLKALGQLKQLTSFFWKKNLDVLDWGQLASNFLSTVSWGFFYQAEGEQHVPQVNAGVGKRNIRLKGDGI